ncbi:MAG: hypothetical protein J0I17_03555 ['Candidatus Kapabacteria' thiocyanatum]|uniref:Dolichol kinase n=1 Tax=Candidatus Kapaibacterium thiocyanatum TaxID=1895771 RepID=A0A1M3KXV6_9BACT|nr:hypothetical protein ['Candidatus Kapabacteria' thiocyanatum]OJX57227.1 MAG: hypothetical protein BGO89_12085 ['Candidatus Kapabacteria' thiocyanatum]
MSDSAQITYGNELARKGIHITSLLIPIIYLQISRPAALWILVPMMVVAILIDMLMHYHEPTRALMLRLFGSLLRDHELRTDRLLLNGASWVLIAATLMVLLFPKVIAVTAFSILIISDTFAALVGRRFGTRPFLDKSVVGTMTFILTAIVVVGVYAAIYSLPWTYVASGAIGAVLGGVAEAGSIRLKLDDNISIPFSIAITMLVLGIAVEAQGLPAFIGALS